ncbi:MAG: NADH-quinone oxidoreductase subunit H [Planctomycetota bacterium]
MIDNAVHVAILILAPPLLQGVIVKTKAFFAGRVGAPLLQPYLDLWKLLQKDMVLSRTTTWMFLAGPAITLAATVMAGLLAPLGSAHAPIHFAGDIILFAYLLALGRFFTAAAALDTGSAFEGMGAAREVTFACLAEPAMFLGLLALVRVTDSLELSGLLGGPILHGWASAAPTMLMVLAGLFVVTLAENCRIPIDDPNTHLELTMIHEVMVLDHSGPALGAILYGAAVKLFIIGSIVARLAVPVATGVFLVDWLAFLLAMLLFAVAIGVVESIMARLKLVHVPNLLIGAGLLTGFGFVLLLMR